MQKINNQLIQAIKNRDLSSFRQALQVGADPAFNNNQPIKLLEYIIYNHIWEGTQEINKSQVIVMIKLLLQHNSVNPFTDRLLTILAYKDAQLDYLDVFKLLIENQYITSDIIIDALSLALESGHIVMAELLLSENLYIKYNLGSEITSILLYKAILSGNVKAVNLILPYITDHNMDSELLEYAINKGYVEIVDLLSRCKKIDINKYNRHEIIKSIAYKGVHTNDIDQKNIYLNMFFNMCDVYIEDTERKLVFPDSPSVITLLYKEFGKNKCVKDNFKLLLQKEKLTRSSQKNTPIRTKKRQEELDKNSEKFFNNQDLKNIILNFVRNTKADSNNLKTKIKYETSQMENIINKYPKELSPSDIDYYERIKKIRIKKIR